MDNKFTTPVPTDSELEILQVLWQNGAQTVRFVNETLNKQKPEKEIGYTTTLKFMQLMLDKGLLTREIIDRSHIYSPAIPEEKTQEQLLNGFVNSAFRGSASSLVLRALGNGNTTQAELEKIKALINEIEQNK
ncbi:MAG: BlaI/MecI/CopY family transcriptional regulator [Saprospiraceae bacterium]|nr:BlaI/MecI/CopY family transcriptional regulator [Saprospiraceae bacterium]